MAGGSFGVAGVTGRRLCRCSEAARAGLLALGESCRSPQQHEVSSAWDAQGPFSEHAQWHMQRRVSAGALA